MLAEYSLIENTLRVEGKLYHSKYNPQIEVERFFSTLTINENAICILLAPGLGLLANHIRHKLPEAKVFCVQPECFRVLRSISDADTTWFEGSTISLPQQLSEWISDDDVSRIELIVWPAGWKLLNDFCKTCGAFITNFIKESAANNRTTEYFGQRWLKNIVNNIKYLPNIQFHPHSQGTAVLAGSGPGLNHCKDLLLRFRANYSLWALPSSLRALKKWGIVPDFVVTSDAGYWAAEHLQYLPLETNASSPIILAPSRAMLSPLWKSELPVALFNMGYPFEDKLVDIRFGNSLYRYNDTQLLDRGTVAASALDILKVLHRGPIISMGLDFAWHDLRAHTNPHTFDEQKICAISRLLHEETYRYDERERQKAVRLESGWVQMTPLDIYQNWMAHAGYSKFLQVFDYNPSMVNKGLINISFFDLEMKLSLSNPFPAILAASQRPMPSKPNFEKQVKAYLLKIKAVIKNECPINGLYPEFYRMLCPSAWRDYNKKKSTKKQLCEYACDQIEHLFNLSDEE